MFQLEVLRNQWAIVGVFGGLGLTLMMVLYYLAVWRPRHEPAVRTPPPEHRSFIHWLVFAFPWILIVLYVSLGLYGLIYLLMQIKNPPNW